MTSTLRRTRTRREGFRRLNALTEGRLNYREPAGRDPSLLDKLDAWENRWFPIANASLRARFPSVQESDAESEEIEAEAEIGAV